MSPDKEILSSDLDAQKPGKIDTSPVSSVECVTGFKLFLIVSSVALACFLMLLDTMVIGTVSSPCHIDYLYLQRGH